MGVGKRGPEKQALAYADITNPQSLNKYQYTFNNPLRYVDQDGRAPQDSFDNKINQLIRQQLKGEITEKQFRESLRGPAVGTADGLAIIVAVRGGAPILTALARGATLGLRATGTAVVAASLPSTIMVGGRVLTASPKIVRQAARRGWTEKLIQEAVGGGQKFSAINKLRGGTAATRYVHPTTGQSVVIDNITNEIIHIGARGFRY